MILEHESENLRCSYNGEQRILFVTYRGVLTPDVTRSFYQWLGSVIASHPQEISRALGSVYDFREVKNFDNRNINAAQRESQQFNAQTDMSNHPVALIVQSKLQEQLVRIELKISPQQDRKRIVFSEKEALEFIESFHKTASSPEENV